MRKVLWLMWVVLCLHAAGFGQYIASNGLRINTDGNIMANMSGGAANIVTSWGFPLDSSGNIMIDCQSGCSGNSLPFWFSPANISWGYGPPVTITSWSGSGGVVTFQAVNTFVAGAEDGPLVRLGGFASSTFFNGLTVEVLSTGLSGTQFEVSFAGYSGGTDTGVAVPGINGGQNTVSGSCSDKIGNTEGYGFIAPYSGSYGHLWINVQTGDNTVGDNYEFSILKPTTGRTDLSILGHTTPAPISLTPGPGIFPTSFALNTNVTLVGGQEYVLGCSVSAGNTAIFWSPVNSWQSFPAATLSASAFPASGYTVPALAYTPAPAQAILQPVVNFGLAP